MTDPQLPPPPPGFVPPSAPTGATQPYPGTTAGPAYQAPPGAYDAPVGGYAAPGSGYAAPGGGYAAPAPAQPGSPALGVIALLLSLVAAIIAPLLVGIVAYQIGSQLPSIANDLNMYTNDLSFLAPVRDQVLWGEISFWAGTLVGVAAVVIGIFAIAKRRGRAQGIAGLIIALVAPFIYFIVLFFALMVGAGAGAVATYGA